MSTVRFYDQLAPFYHLLFPLHESFIGFNVFRYITFRSILAAVTAFLIVIILGNWFIRTLKRMQIGQVVRDDGPETHIYKQGVPTMGGLLILAAVIGSSFLWARLDNSYVWLTMTVTVFFGFIGAVDDYRKISKKSSAGLSARKKLLLQFIGAGTVGQIQQPSAFVFYGGLPNSLLGYSLRDAGDVDGDGYGDLIAGAPETTSPPW